MCVDNTHTKISCGKSVCSSSFETTDWEVLRETGGEDVDSLTNCTTDYINFSVENTKTVQCFSNNKPCVTSDLKALLNEKKSL
ncbi:hypothetical protein NFI96_028797 [Prochilodus magdalenae]|nr:hypothetical protein NFI96_028797 [Prochilodus magdalenae]